MRNKKPSPECVGMESCDCNNPQHTQTPWKDENVDWANLGNGNRAFIVRAVNCHEDMKYALQQARGLLIDRGITNDLIDKAIAKAEKKP